MPPTSRGRGDALIGDVVDDFNYVFGDKELGRTSSKVDTTETLAGRGLATPGATAGPDEKSVLGTLLFNVEEFGLTTTAAHLIR